MSNTHFLSSQNIMVGQKSYLAVRKAKFFLHPDKLPKDLTNDQTLLFKTLWGVLLEREALTLG